MRQRRPVRGHLDVRQQGELDKLTGTLRSGSYPRDRRLPRPRRLPDRPARADHSTFSARHGNDVGNADNLPGLLIVHLKASSSWIRFRFRLTLAGIAHMRGGLRDEIVGPLVGLEDRY